MAGMFVGGWNETMDATEKTQRICDQVKGQVERETGVNYKEFTAIKYRNQIVAGQNYLIKVHVGGVNYIHLSIFQAIPCYREEKIELCCVEQHKTKNSPLIPFLN